MSNDLKLLRLLVRQIKDTCQWKTVKDKRVVQYVLKESHAHKETCEVFCKARTELKSLAENVLVYLNSQQKYQDIQNTYGNKSELSVQEVADLVGFKLPSNTK